MICEVNAICSGFGTPECFVCVVDIRLHVDLKLGKLCILVPLKLRCITSSLMEFTYS